MRYHVEDQSRIQANGDTPRSRRAGTGPNAGIKEDSDRSVTAYSGFVQNRFDFGRWSVTPGLRLEHVEYERIDNLLGTRGESSIDQWVPGLAATFQAVPGTVVFAGVHRGFAPPGVADIVTAAGGSVDLDAELSWNYELGLRSERRSTACRSKRRCSAWISRIRSCRRASQEAWAPRSPAPARRCSRDSRLPGRIEGNAFVDWPVGAVRAPLLHLARRRRIRRRALQQRVRLRRREGHRQPAAVRARTPVLGHGRRPHRASGFELQVDGVYDQRRLHGRLEYGRCRRPRPARARLRATRSGTHCELCPAAVRVHSVRHRQEPRRQAVCRRYEPRLTPGMPRLVQAGFELRF
jgi:hypothetical protein